MKDSKKTELVLKKTELVLKGEAEFYFDMLHCTGGTS